MKELEKTYDPAAIEDRLYEKWLNGKYFHAEVKPQQKALYHCDAAAKYHRTASHGPCSGQYHAGYFNPL